MTTKSLGATIRELRKLKGLSVPKLAAQLAVSQSYIYDLEHDRRVPSVPMLRRFADFFGVTTDELMSAPSEDNKNAPAGSPGEGDNYGIQ